MKNFEFINNYLQAINVWAKYKVGIYEDFDQVCTCHLDYVELLLIGEEKFSLNLLETSKTRYDFKTLKDFIEWAGTNSIIPIPCKAMN